MSEGVVQGIPTSPSQGLSSLSESDLANALKPTISRIEEILQQGIDRLCEASERNVCSPFDYTIACERVL
jgi:hypothetical protein